MTLRRAEGWAVEGAGPGRECVWVECSPTSPSPPHFSVFRGKYEKSFLDVSGEFIPFLTGILKTARLHLENQALWSEEGEKWQE